jgi:hypothetical protein
MDIREEVSRRIGRADLVKLVAGKVPQRSIYNFLSDDPSDIGSTALGHIFDALKIVLVDERELKRLQAEVQRLQSVVKKTDRLTYLKSRVGQPRRLGDRPISPAKLNEEIAALEKELNRGHVEP